MLAKILLCAAIILAMGGVACADPPPPAGPDPISLDPLSPSVVGFGNTASDIYGEAFGPTGMGWDVVGGTGPILHVSNFAYGLNAMDDNDAHSLGDNDPNVLPIVYFSANRRSRGAWNTQYRHQANRNQAAGDRFVTNGWMNMSPAQSYATGFPAAQIIWQPGLGPNLLSANQTRYNEIPSIPPQVVNPTMNPSQIDDMDALELHPMDFDGNHVHDLPLFFSLAPGSPSMPPGGSPADIYLSPAGSGLFFTWATPAMMGLQPTDNIDALVVFNVGGTGQQAMPGVDYALFSLAPGNSYGISGADVLVTNFQGVSRVYFRAADIGLLGKDNVDGLDVELRIEGNEFPQIWDELDPTVVPPLTPIPPAKNNPDGTPVNTRGIVTLIGSNYIYIEEPDRSSGIRIQYPTAVPWYVSLGDDLQAIGVIGVFDGERAIFPTEPVSEISSGNPVPAPFDLRTRSVGGDDFDALNRGITNGEGALNVGLRAKVMGMVTAVDPSAAPQWFYIWDGANRGNTPLDDGTGNLGVRVEYAVMAAPLVPWRDWVDVTGVVSTDAAVVAGRVIPLMLPESTPTVVTTFDSIQSCSLKASWNLTALPVAPAGSSDGIEHSAKPWDPPVIFAGGDPTQIDGRMYRWESCGQSMYIWDIWMDDHVSNWAWGPFGGALLGDGYWIDSFFDVTYTYSGKRSDQDKWVSVCEPGWIILGYPKENGMLWEDVKVHDGAQILSLRDASQYGANWLNSVGYWWDASFQSLLDIGIPDDWPSTLDLKSCHGYWFEFYQGNKSLIFPADATAKFQQVDWKLDGVVTNDSEWGSLDLTFSRSLSPQYLNLNVNGSWQAQDLPLLSVEGTSGPFTVNIMFDLGTPRGTNVTNVSYGYTITNSPQYAPPAATNSALVPDRAFELESGLLGSIAGPPVAAGPIAGDAVVNSGAHTRPFPNQQSGPKQCVPTAVSNSLQFLNAEHDLGMDAAAITPAAMAPACGGGPGVGCPWTWYDYKIDYMTSHNLPIATLAEVGAAINMQDVIDGLKNGSDVEMVLRSPSGTGGHCVCVTGCTKNANGTYTITVSHDTNQNDNNSGTKSEVLTYDPATGKVTGGSLNGWKLEQVVIEEPMPE